MDWNNELWSKAWNEAIKIDEKYRREHTAPLLIEVYQDTLSRVKAGGYDLHGTWIDLKLNPDIQSQTIFYDGPIDEVKTENRSCKTEVAVMPVDCLVLARELVLVEVFTQELVHKKNIFSDVQTTIDHSISMESMRCSMG